MTLCKRGWQLDNRLTDLWKQLRFKQKLVDQKTNKRADRERAARYSTVIIYLKYQNVTSSDWKTKFKRSYLSIYFFLSIF